MDESFQITLMQTLSTLLCSTEEADNSVVRPLEIYKRRMFYCHETLQNDLQPENEAQLSSESEDEMEVGTESAVEVPQQFIVLPQYIIDLMDAECAKSDMERKRLAEQGQSDVMVKLEHGEHGDKRTKRNAKGKLLLPTKSGEKRIQRKPRKFYRGPPIPMLGRTVRRRFIPTSPLSMDVVLKKFGDRKVFKFQFKDELESEKPKDLEYMLYI